MGNRSSSETGTARPDRHRSDPIVSNGVFCLTRDQIAAVVLAAGASRRMGFPKALARIGSTTFLGRILRTYQAAGIPAWVVVGPDCGELQSLPELAFSATIVNPRPELGPLSSFRLALRELTLASGVILHPVDHPLVGTHAIESLTLWHRRAPACILVPSHHGLKGHPTLFPGRFFPDLRDCPLDEGARAVVRQNPASTLLVPVEDAGVLANLNTPSDLARWRVPNAAPPSSKRA